MENEYRIKQEAEELLCLDKKDGVSVSKTEPQPKPYELLHEVGQGVPPFLRKTYEIIENPKTDEIISWGENGVSFVVWDIYKFSNHLLPNYFKHSNFSTFVRQLNTYGFRKVNFDRWEFANSAFQRGKKHLLKSIKRKYHGGNKSSTLNFLRGTEFEEVKLEHETLKAEIHDLKQEQLNSNQCLASMEERMKSVEWKQKEFLLFIAKAMKRTPLFQQLLLKYEQKNALENGQVLKRRRLTSGESLDPVGLGPCTLEERSSSSTSETSSSDLSSGNYIMWEKLMEDDVICEDDDEEAFDVAQTNFVHELEDLIGRPLSCGSLANLGDEVGEVTCLGGNKLSVSHTGF